MGDCERGQRDVGEKIRVGRQPAIFAVVLFPHFQALTPPPLLILQPLGGAAEDAVAPRPMSWEALACELQAVLFAQQAILFAPAAVQAGRHIPMLQVRVGGGDVGRLRVGWSSEAAGIGRGGCAPCAVLPVYAAAPCVGPPHRPCCCPSAQHCARQRQ